MIGILWPLITVAQTIPVVATPVFIEGSSTDGIALVASSTLPTPTPQELVIQAFPDAPVMVRIAAAESSFIPTAKNPASTATGIFQILSGTFKSYKCDGVQSNASDNIACARKIYNKEGTAPWNSSKNVWGY